MGIRSWRNNEKRASFLIRTAREIRNYKVRMKLLSIVLAMLVAMMAGIYVVSALYKDTGSFTVSLNKYDMTEYGISLSETKDMEYKTSHLNAQIAEHMTNIAGADIPNTVGQIDGEHNGDTYIAYTFYVENAGTTAFNYEYDVIIKKASNGIDEAIRMRLYVNDVPTTYAKTASDGSGNEPGTEAFYTNSIMAHGRFDSFEPGQKTKYTILLWIEGPDPDCNDWVVGGEMKVDMEIGVAH